MITDYAQMSVKLSSLLNNEQAKTAIHKALSTYPLYQGKKQYDLIPTREQLNQKILNHYKYREIGFETIGRFIEELEITMSEIMPYYNELFKTVEIMADLENPFDNVDIIEVFDEQKSQTSETSGQASGSSSNTSSVEGEGSSTNTTTVNGNNTADKTRKFSDTPQNNVNNLDNYLTDYTLEHEQNNVSNTENVSGSTTSKTETVDGNSSSSSTSSNFDGSETTKHTFTKKGNQGVNTYAHDMIEFRHSIMDVVDRILHDNRLAELFMLVW